MTDNTRSLTNILNSTLKTVFNTQDFNNIWKYENYPSLIQRLNYLTKTGKIRQIKKGFYSITGREIDEFELANKLRTPSYISFESALHKEGIIFQWDGRITLAAKESLKMEILDQKIVFRQMKDPILLNKRGIEKHGNYYIASRERAFLDVLYLNPNFVFDNLRRMDFEEAKEIAQIYERKSLLKILTKLEKYAESY